MHRQNEGLRGVTLLGPQKIDTFCAALSLKGANLPNSLWEFVEPVYTLRSIKSVT